MNCHTPEVDQCHNLGWQFQPDTSHPKNKELGYYTMFLSDRAYGWYIKESHPVKNRLVGDSTPRWMAARTILNCWEEAIAQ